MNCKKCGEKIGRGKKAYREPYHKTCYRQIGNEKFALFMAGKGFVDGARVEGENLLTQTSPCGTIVAVRPWAQAHETILVEWDGGGIGSYPWNYLKVVTDSPAYRRLRAMLDVAIEDVRENAGKEPEHSYRLGKAAGLKAAIEEVGRM